MRDSLPPTGLKSMGFGWNACQIQMYYLESGNQINRIFTTKCVHALCRTRGQEGKLFFFIQNSKSTY
jgi:hypothetical protein